MAGCEEGQQILYMVQCAAVRVLASLPVLDFCRSHFGSSRIGAGGERPPRLPPITEPDAVE